jgi:mycothiol system anti-sigma-R factor
MNCEDAIKIMDGYLDGELDALTSQNIEQHLRECGRCRQGYEAQRVLVRMIQSSAPYYTASSQLRERIQSSLRRASNGATVFGLRQEPRSAGVDEIKRRRSIIPLTSWNWLALAAAILLAAIVTFNLLPRQQKDQQFLATQLIGSHVRSLMANHLTDVASSDQHTVKPWLDERLDFAAPVVDLAGEGFPLIGGRLDYVDNHPVAALVYQRRKHFINLFMWPAEPGTSQTSETTTRQGYQLLHWTDSDFNYWAVSDVNATDLRTFKQLFEKQVPHG